MMKKVTVLDKLINDDWFEDKTEAKKWIMLRRVLINDALVLDGNQKIDATSNVRIKEHYKTKYVNKGGLKLEGAISYFNLNITGKVALDCGACTGGFTDCLLIHGASTVYAVDAGHSQLAGKLLQNSNVINLEETNLADQKLKILDPKPDIITLDLSYLSLKTAIPLCKAILHDTGQILCLIKPIYEVNSADTRRNGDINHPYIFKNVLLDLVAAFTELGLTVQGVTNSTVRGNKGVCEFFMLLSFEYSNADKIDIDSEIDEAIVNAMALDKFKK